jgi:hypothetical protein
MSLVAQQLVESEARSIIEDSYRMARDVLAQSSRRADGA